jgi:hypothetical protein
MALIGAVGEKQAPVRVPDKAHDAIHDWPDSADGDKSPIRTDAHRAAHHIFRRSGTIFDCGFPAKCAARDQRIHFGSSADRQESTDCVEKPDRLPAGGIGDGERREG